MDFTAFLRARAAWTKHVRQSIPSDSHQQISLSTAVRTPTLTLHDAGTHFPS